MHARNAIGVHSRATNRRNAVFYKRSSQVLTNFWEVDNAHNGYVYGVVADYE